MARWKSTYAGERRTKFCGFNVTPTEYEIVQRRAAGTGHLRSDYLRSAALGYPLLQRDAEAACRKLAKLRANHDRLPKAEAKAAIVRFLDEEGF